MTISSQAVLQVGAKLLSLNRDGLTVFKRLAGQYTTFATHVNAVRRLLALRDGVQNLGWNGYIKTAVMGLVWL